MPDVLGNVYITGFFYGTVDFDPGPGVYNLSTIGNNADIFISCLNASGNFLWAKSVGGSDGEGGEYLDIGPSGKVMVSGSFSSQTLVFGTDTITNADNSGTNYDCFVAMLDSMTIVTANNSFVNSNNNISLFPNPSRSAFTVYNIPFTISNIELYNVFGEKILSKQPVASGQKQITVDVSTLVPGIYFVTLMSNSERVVKKITVLH